MRELLIFIICSFTLVIACSEKDDSLDGNESKFEEDNAKFTERLNEKEKMIEN
ncbi:hypothetical protein [Psychrobacillus sp. L4]|uniref:hypothetical protein n=1 Tax=Psychrobacillus sp. L4 TaxID=3236892 RepID=UPI0036F3D67A